MQCVLSKLTDEILSANFNLIVGRRLKVAEVQKVPCPFVESVFMVSTKIKLGLASHSTTKVVFTSTCWKPFCHISHIFTPNVKT